MDEVLHFGLQAPPLELDRDQFVGAHLRAVSLISQLFLWREERGKNGKDLQATLLFEKHSIRINNTVKNLTETFR